MPDWGPVFVAVTLFVLLTPGLLIQVPGRGRVVEFGTFQTSGLSVIVHTLIYFTLVCILLLALQIHICNLFFYFNGGLGSSSRRCGPLRDSLTGTSLLITW
ncbi:unnamed protein product [Arabidopsis halleri]